MNPGQETVDHAAGSFAHASEEIARAQAHTGASPQVRLRQAIRDLDQLLSTVEAANLADRQYVDKPLLQAVEACLDRHGLPTGYLRPGARMYRLQEYLLDLQDALLHQLRGRCPDEDDEP
jgi:hypothetical protein